MSYSLGRPLPRVTLGMSPVPRRVCGTTGQHLDTAVLACSFQREDPSLQHGRELMLSAAWPTETQSSEFP